MRKVDAKSLRLKYRMIEPVETDVGPAFKLAEEAIELAEELEEEVNEANQRAETLEEEKDQADRDCCEAEGRVDDLDGEVDDLRDALRTIGTYVEEAISELEAAQEEEDEAVRNGRLEDALRALVNARREVDDNV